MDQENQGPADALKGDWAWQNAVIIQLRAANQRLTDINAHLLDASSDTHNLLLNIAKNLQTVADHFKIVGIAVVPGTPTQHGKDTIMKVTLTKKDPNAKPALKAGPGLKSGPIIGFNLQDNGDATFTVYGVDNAGNQVSISAVANLTVSSDNSSVVYVDTPSGMSSAIHAATPPPAVGATANIVLTATWSDPATAPAGSPFTITWPQTIVPGPVTGIAVQPGTPTVH